jgi:hypothetical protein
VPSSSRPRGRTSSIHRSNMPGQAQAPPGSRERAPGPRDLRIRQAGRRIRLPSIDVCPGAPPNSARPLIPRFYPQSLTLDLLSFMLALSTRPHHEPHALPFQKKRGETPDRQKARRDQALQENGESMASPSHQTDGLHPRAEQTYGEENYRLSTAKAPGRRANVAADRSRALAGAQHRGSARPSMRGPRNWKRARRSRS